MLVLTRKVNEPIHIADNIVLTVVDIHRGRVRLGIEAPPGRCRLHGRNCRRLYRRRSLSPGGLPSLRLEGLTGPDHAAGKPPGYRITPDWANMRSDVCGRVLFRALGPPLAA